MVSGNKRYLVGDNPCKHGYVDSFGQNMCRLGNKCLGMDYKCNLFKLPNTIPFNGEWYSVEVKIPDVSKVLVKYKFGVKEAWVFDGQFFTLGEDKTEVPEVTYWTYLPKFED